MPNIFSKLTSGVYGLNFVWRATLAYYFIFRTQSILNKYSNVRPVTEQGQDMMKFLGGINIGYSLLALLGFIRFMKTDLKENSSRTSELWVLALANFSQFFYSAVAYKNGRWNRNLLRMTIPDGILAVLDFIFALWAMKMNSKKKLIFQAL